MVVHQLPVSAKSVWGTVSTQNPRDLTEVGAQLTGLSDISLVRTRTTLDIIVEELLGEMMGEMEVGMEEVEGLVTEEVEVEEGLGMEEVEVEGVVMEEVGAEVVENEEIEEIRVRISHY